MTLALDSDPIYYGVWHGCLDEIAGSRAQNHRDDSDQWNQERCVMVTEISKFEWDTDLETGIDVVDEQHRRYFVLLNNYLEKASETLSDRNQFFDLLDKFNFLHQYAKEHFSTEELIMQETGFPEFESHRDEHLYFERHVDELYEQLKANGFSLELAREANYYIIEWFVEHIRKADMDLVEFLHNKVSVDKKISGLLKKLYTSLFKTN